MNRNLFRLVFKARLGQYVPLSEVARGRGDAASGAVAAQVVLAGVLGILGAGSSHAALPVAMPNSGATPFNSTTIAGQNVTYTVNGNTAMVNQVGNKSILNWQSFNISAGNTVQFNQVDGSGNLVAGASFTSLNRIWDANPSVIAGAITQGAGQKANVILVNNNGIAFMGGSTVNLNSFTATSLNMADTYVVNGLLGDLVDPQFTAANGSTGFVKVFEGANITAGEQGRVMLLAPTVVNSGTVVAPDGQVILAAGTKVYLRSASGEDSNVRGLLIEVDNTGVTNHTTANTVASGQLDGQSVTLASAADDLMGQATNYGTISAPRGNVTMVGYAVNQSGLASATTSVVANGSVYLLAKDTHSYSNGVTASTRAGQLVLGADSVTQVLPDVSDSTTSQDGTTGAGLVAQSQIRLIGQTVALQSGAEVLAPSGNVSISAVADPSTIVAASSAGNPFTNAGATVDNAAWVDVAAGATIDVSGLSDVAVSAADLTMQLQLRGNELADSPLNRNGALRNQTVDVDIAAALANAEAGNATLMSLSSLQAYAALIARTVAERSTTGGTVSMQSQGQVVMDNGSTLNLSGGSVKYTAAMVPTTMLYAGNTTTTVANASANVLYDGLSTSYTVNYTKWNRSETFNLGQTSVYNPGFIEGKAAGSLSVMGLGGNYLQETLLASTQAGSVQAATGALPAGASLTIGANGIGSAPFDYKTAQQVVFDNLAQSLPANYQDGDALSGTLQVNAAQIGPGQFTNVAVYTNGTVSINAPVKLGQGGSLTAYGSSVDVRANVTAPSGTVDLEARNNYLQPDPNTGVMPNPQLVVEQGVQISTRGAWVNDKLPRQGDGSVPLLNGGSITLKADAIGGDFQQVAADDYDSRGSVVLDSGATLDAGAGAHLNTSGVLSLGTGGSINISAYAIQGLTDSSVVAMAGAKGGTLTLGANAFSVGASSSGTFGTVALDTGFFSSGGFGKYTLNGLTSVEVLAGTVLTPQESNWQFAAAMATAPTGTAPASIAGVGVQPNNLGQGVSLAFNAQSIANGTGTVAVDAGAVVQVAPGSAISMQALDTIDVEGSLVAHGGAISLTVNEGTSLHAVDAQHNMLLLGNNAVLDASGIAQTYQNSQGLTVGTVRNGGTVTLQATSGYVATLAGSEILLDGAAPVYLETSNATGGLGRTVGSDAGALTVFAQEGLLLDGNYSAQPGGAGNRGGIVSMTLSGNDTTVQTAAAGFDPVPRFLTLAQSAPVQTNGIALNSAITVTGTSRGTIDIGKLDAAGFDQMSFSSRDAIVLANGLTLGSGRALPMQSLTLDAARIITLGGNVSLQAYTVSLGNFDANNRLGGEDTGSNYSSTGTLTVQSTLLELAGNLRLRGMATADLTGSQMVELAGVTQTVSNNGQTQYTDNATIDIGANAVITGAVVAPATYSTVNLSATGYNLTFANGGATASQPLMDTGSLNVSANNIVQGGNLWSPLGSISLTAVDNVNVLAGSLTSVAAMPGTVLPLGQMQNGTQWVENLASGDVPNGQTAVNALPQKSVKIAGASVNLASGAVVNLAGGGNAQSYEFTVGPSGTSDILAQPNTYAILPGYTGFSPADPQESFALAAGTAVHLSGVAGLADGTYILLPAHYALLPGAMAVTLNPGSVLQPYQAYTRADGVQVASGYLTDTRVGAPKDATPEAVTVLTQAQIEARSQLTTYSASQTFSTNLPQDAGHLAISTSGSGAGSLVLNATFDTAAASGGQGAQVDISASKIALVASGTSYSDASYTSVDVGLLDAMGAQSLLIGATRSTSNGVSTLTVGANQVVLANSAAQALEAPEVMLAAQVGVTLQAGSALNAQGTSNVANVAYVTSGDGAFVRAATTTASFTRSNVSGTTGTLSGNVSSNITAANAITLDASVDNTYAGALQFSNGATAVAGNLAVGSSRVSFGAAPANTPGLVYSQAQMDSFSSLNSMTLTSYSTFDLYGGVQVGAVDGNGLPTLKNLSLFGGGLAGLANGGQTASVRAQNLTIANPGGAAYVPGGTLGSGTLDLTADTLYLGAGATAVQGYANVAVAATEVVAQGSGSIAFAAPTTVTTQRLSGANGASGAISSSGALIINAPNTASALAAVSSLGAQFALSGSSVTLDTAVVLPSGNLTVTATGDVQLGTQAQVDVSGRNETFFDTTSATSGGTVALTSSGGNVALASGANINVSGAAGSSAGGVQVSAVAGSVTLAPGSLTSNANNGAAGGSVAVTADAVGNFSALNSVFNSGGFTAARTVRALTGDLTVASSDSMTASSIALEADSGAIQVNGTVSAAGATGGSVHLAAGNVVALNSGASVDVSSSQSGSNGGSVEIDSNLANADGSAAAGVVLASGSTVNLAAGSGGTGGTLLLRVMRSGIASNGVGAGTGVNLGTLAGSISGASAVNVEGVKVYTGVTTLNVSTSTDTGASAGTLGQTGMASEDTSFASSSAVNALRTQYSALPLSVLAGVEVQSQSVQSASQGNITLSGNWNLANVRTGPNVGVNGAGDPGVLTLRAAGNLQINGNLSDGFSSATAYSSGTTPASVDGGKSWSYQLVAGADLTAADAMQYTGQAGNFSLAAGELIRTGTGNISVAASGNIVLGTMSAGSFVAGSTASVIYTAGAASAALSDFSGSTIPTRAQFTQGGGNVSLRAGGNITAAPTAQLYSEWLYRQGNASVTASGVVAYDTAGGGTSTNRQPAWWVRFDQFQQGVGALGGGNVSVSAGGTITNLSVSTPTQGRMNANTADAAAMDITGGGNVNVVAGGSILGGTYYADNGVLDLSAGGSIASAQPLAALPLYTLLALGNAQANVEARGDVNIAAVINPQLLPQSFVSGNTPTTGNVTSSGTSSNTETAFSTYGAGSGVSLASLDGNVNLQQGATAATLASYDANLMLGGGNDEHEYGSYGTAYAAMLEYMPPSLSMTAYSGDVSIQSTSGVTLAPSATGQLRLLAKGSLNLQGLTMSDSDPALTLTYLDPVNMATFKLQGASLADLHAGTPVHADDNNPVLFYAVNGSITDLPTGDSIAGGTQIVLPKAVDARAGLDVVNLDLQVQNVNAALNANGAAADQTVVQAGRDITYSSFAVRSDADGIELGGEGKLLVDAGRNINLGTSGGIVTVGNLSNANLPSDGASIYLTAGAGAAGVDYNGALLRLQSELQQPAPSVNALWLARWLLGDDTLSASAAATGVAGVLALDTNAQRFQVVAMVDQALLMTGRDHNDSSSPFAGDYTRGYAALELLFPGITEAAGESMAAGAAASPYQGSINLFASRIKTDSGGDINFLTPGGGVTVGLANTPAALVGSAAVGSNVLGIVAAGPGNIEGFARDDILVNQSRILTVDGGSLMLWSSYGDIDAGKGAKTASAVPPPVVTVDAQGNVTEQLQGAASGSGIGALTQGHGAAGNVDLIAPNGTVNAGDAGIRAGNLNIAAQAVLGADNISVSGTSSGTPVADTSAVTASASGASSSGNDISKTIASLASAAADAANAANAMAESIKPSYLRVDVLSYGDAAN